MNQIIFSLIRLLKFLVVINFTLYKSFGYDLGQLRSNVDINNPHTLREISNRVISNPLNISWAQTDLRKKHSQISYNLWRDYNKDTLPGVNDLQYLSTTYGSPFNSKKRDQLKSSLIGKTDQTLIPDQFIDNDINILLPQALQNGNINLILNARNGEPSIEIRYNVQDFAQVSSKGENAPPPPPTPLVNKNEMVVILGVKMYIDALLLDRDALTNNVNSLEGKITTIY